MVPSTWSARLSKTLWDQRRKLRLAHATSMQFKILPIRVCAEEMGHPQGPTPVQVDNTTDVGFANKTTKQKMSKAIDMRLYWLQDRKDQGQFKIFWIPGKKNLADYHRKNYPPSHHTVTRPTILYSSQYVICFTQCLMRGCVNPPKIAHPIRAYLGNP